MTAESQQANAELSLVNAESTWRTAEMTFKKLIAGGTDDDIFKVTIYLTDMSHFPKIMELRQSRFTPPYPADTIVEVRSLALPELMIEIDAMALVPTEGVRGVRG